MRCFLLVAALVAGGCGGGSLTPKAEMPVAGGSAPDILLITLDTTRADAMGFDGERGLVDRESPARRESVTPNLDALAARGARFELAHTTAPTTLPAHTSMLTGKYPSEHGVHENSRPLAEDEILLASILQNAGYRTAALVSGFPLTREFGLARGFDSYDDDFGSDTRGRERVERIAAETTDRALALLRSLGREAEEPLFLWVHYYDAHEPYDPPEPFRSTAPSLYLGEVAYVDQQVGRLLGGFEEALAGRPQNVLVTGDHGEGLGDHGELLHGNLLYQSVMRVPLVLVGSGVEAGKVLHPVSVRRVFDTVLEWAGLDAVRLDLRSLSSFGDAASADEEVEHEVVLGEAMKPFLQYGWQPQVMALWRNFKVISAGRLEIYDLVADAKESSDRAGEVELDPRVRSALRDYPLPGAGAEKSGSLSEETRRKLASLGYVTSEVSGAQIAGLQADAPRPVDMAHLFTALDQGSRLFVEGDYGNAIGVFEQVAAADPENLMVQVRLAVAHSALGHRLRAADHFERARKIAPQSIDVRHYHGMHLARSGRWSEAEPLLESVVAAQPRRRPALEALAEIRRQQGRLEEAADLLEVAVGLRASPDTLLKLGDLRMATGRTDSALRAFESALDATSDAADFPRYLELGVLHLASRDLGAARDALDRVPGSHPELALAMFKRAQVSVLLAEPDRAVRVALARRLAVERGDQSTRDLIEREPLFAGLLADR